MTGFWQVDPFGPALSPLILAGLFGLGWLYRRGLARARRLRTRAAPRRAIFFWLGLLAMVIATTGPLPALGVRLFWIHQIDHVLMRLLGPLLVAMAQPWPAIAAGLPRPTRHRLARFAARSPVHVLRHPVTATLLLIGVFYIWHIPTLFRLAAALPALGALAHVTMMLTGPLFFTMLLDARDPPAGARRSARLLCGVALVFSTIQLGALVTLKEVVAFGPPRPRLGLPALLDETIGGMVIWAPSSALAILATFMALHGLHHAEERRWAMRHEIMRRSNSAALEFPETAEELWIKVAKPNRVTARILGLVAVGMFTMIVTMTISIVSGGP